MNAKTKKFTPIMDGKRRRFDKELILLLTTASSNYKAMQLAWQNDPAVIQWCDKHTDHWVRLVKQYKYNKGVKK